ncbi:NEQ036 [Nanoarchaeum equitans Kin4-M]|uniref:NEQ036 n=1 Tax=Nanoarchaeum equitans (strain Kin4-M) TaxID=228908 RepID=Q74N56_NANEQ|nr:NEQ036 [Nanoarchaeum equitans Kin4-M]
MKLNKIVALLDIIGDLLLCKMRDNYYIDIYSDENSIVVESEDLVVTLKKSKNDKVFIKIEHPLGEWRFYANKKELEENLKNTKFAKLFVKLINL